MIIDNQVNDLLAKELIRQRSQLNLIASENIVSPEVLRIQGNIATNKYAEGYPGSRYYSGCEVVDAIEQLAIDRAKTLFGVQHVNVQSHAGAQANAAVMLALLKPGDAFLGLKLAHGGHLSHGSKVNISGQLYQSNAYELGQDELIDYEAIESLALDCQPKLIIAGFSSYSRLIDWQRFREIADRVGAYLLADIAHTAGLVAAGVFPSPVPYAHVVTTTTHKTLRGPRGAMIMVPNDQALAQKVDKAVFPGIQGGPMMHTIAAKAAAFYEASLPSFKLYQRNVLQMSKAVAQRLTAKGMAIASGSTDTHQFVLKLVGDQQLSGAEAERLLGRADVLVNKNMVPFDTKSPRQTSGIRLGFAAAVSRGVTELEMLTIADHIADLIQNSQSSGKLNSLKQCVAQTLEKHPLYEHL